MVKNMFNVEIETIKGKAIKNIKGLTFGQAMNELAGQLDGASRVNRKTSLADLCLRVAKDGAPDFYITLDSSSNATTMNKALASSDHPINLYK